LFVVGSFSFIFGLWFMTGIEPDPEYFNRIIGMTWDQFVAGKQGMVVYVMDSLKMTGALLLGLGIITMAISATAFRKGEQWAWYALWYFPFFLAWTVWLFYAHDQTSWPLPLHMVLLVFSLLGLLLPYKSFFSEVKRKERGDN
jgi:hypothetical protein